jgi:outer membrane lipoprotein-sorting protein
MKRHSGKQRAFGLAACLLTIMSFAGAAFSQRAPVDDLTVEEILKRSDDAEGYESLFAEMEQIITTTGGQERTLAIRTWAVDSGDRQLAEYLSPPDIRGQKILMTEDGDNIWSYNPETRRTRKLGSHMKKRKVMGSDFSYEDQAGGKASEKYTGVLLDEEDHDGVPCYVLELSPTPKGPSYHRVIAWVAKTDFIVRRMDYYSDEEDEPFKRLVTEDIRKAGEKLFPYRMIMTNLEDDSHTTNVITRIQFGVKIPDSIFESRNLER